MTDEPRLYQHAVALYNGLSERSKDGMFVGSKVEVFRSAKISQGYYSILYGVLEELGCIQTLVSGRGGGRPSQVRLDHPPDLKNFQEAYRNHLTKPTEHDTLSQRVSNIEGRLPKIDIASVLVDFERRIAALEGHTREVDNFGKAT